MITFWSQSPQAKCEGTPFVVSGTGRPVRQFAYSEDVAHLLLWVLDTYDDITPLNLASSGSEVCFKVLSLSYLIILPMPSLRRAGIDRRHRTWNCRSHAVLRWYCFRPFATWRATPKSDKQFKAPSSAPSLPFHDTEARVPKSCATLCRQSAD